MNPNAARSPCRQDAFCEGTQDRGFRDAVVEGLAVAPRGTPDLKAGARSRLSATDAYERTSRSR